MCLWSVLPLTVCLLTGSWRPGLSPAAVCCRLAGLEEELRLSNCTAGVQPCTALYTAVQLEAGSDQLPGLTHCNKMQLSAEILPARPPYPEVSDLTWLDLPDKQLSEINKSERELQISPTSRAIFLVSEHAQTRFILSFHPFITGEAASGGKLFTGFFLSSPPHNRLNNYSSNIINTFLFFQWQLTGSDLNPCTTCNLLEKRNFYTYLVFISKFRFSCDSFEAE